MADQPVWFGQLNWTDPQSVAYVRAANIPALSGCYVFSESVGPLVPGHVLYVGKAVNLRTRLAGYLVDYKQVKPTAHKGRAFLFEYRERAGSERLFLRWTLYGDPRSLEGSLIGYLHPDLNDRFEAEMLDDAESLDPSYR